MKGCRHNSRNWWGQERFEFSAFSSLRKTFTLNFEKSALLFLPLYWCHQECRRYFLVFSIYHENAYEDAFVCLSCIVVRVSALHFRLEAVFSAFFLYHDPSRFCSDPKLWELRGMGVWRKVLGGKVCEQFFYQIHAHRSLGVLRVYKSRFSLSDVFVRPKRSERWWNYVDFHGSHERILYFHCATADK